MHNAHSKFDTGVDTSAPLKTLYHSHESLVEALGELGELPVLVEQAQRSQRLAATCLERFHKHLLEHHADEERALFPAVTASAKPGEEGDRVKSMVRQLTAEHRELERMWATLEPAVEAAAKGRCEAIDGELLHRLVSRYSHHARFEEDHFLPLAQEILQRDANHLGALGVSLHMRRVPPFSGHI
jgi:hemerythrin-like domain-containing protein